MSEVFDRAVALAKAGQDREALELYWSIVGPSLGDLSSASSDDGVLRVRAALHGAMCTMGLMDFCNGLTLLDYVASGIRHLTGLELARYYYVRGHTQANCFEWDEALQLFESAAFSFELLGMASWVQQARDVREKWAGFAAKRREQLAREFASIGRDGLVNMQYFDAFEAAIAAGCTLIRYDASFSNSAGALWPLTLAHGKRIGAALRPGLEVLELRYHSAPPEMFARMREAVAEGVTIPELTLMRQLTGGLFPAAETVTAAEAASVAQLVTTLRTASLRWEFSMVADDAVAAFTRTLRESGNETLKSVHFVTHEGQRVDGGELMEFLERKH